MLGVERSFMVMRGVREAEGRCESGYREVECGGKEGMGWLNIGEGKG